MPPVLDTGLLAGSAQRASSQALQRGPFLRLDTEGLLSNLTQRTSFQVGKESLLSRSTERASFQAQQGGTPLGLGKDGIL